MISLSDMRTRLFKLADHVVATGEPLFIERKGVRLRLIRDDSLPIVRARLAQLTERVAVIGAPLSPEESPALWSGLSAMSPGRRDLNDTRQALSGRAARKP
jgi:hypothetical protein